MAFAISSWRKECDYEGVNTYIACTKLTSHLIKFTTQPILRCLLLLARRGSINSVPKQSLTLDKFVLESHVGFRLKTDTGAEDVGQCTTLLGQSIDNRCTRWGQGSLRTGQQSSKVTRVAVPTFSM